MKKFKFINLLIVLLLITGCSGTYNLNIDSDLTVKEELDVTLENEADKFDELNSLLFSKDVDKDDYKITIKGNDLVVNYKQEYDSIESYLLDSLFENISYNNSNNEIILETNNVFNLKNSLLDNSKNIKLLQINVSTPLTVLDENSDIISEDTYSWTIDSSTKEKNIYFSFSNGAKDLNNGSIIIISTFIICLIVIVIIIIKRMLDSNKI